MRKVESEQANLSCLSNMELPFPWPAKDVFYLDENDYHYLLSSTTKLISEIRRYHQG
jgi:hypothetical protein